MTVIVLWLLMITGAILQNTSLLTLDGVKPNLVLVIAVLAVFFIESLWVYLLILATGLVFLQTAAPLERPLILLLGMAALIFLNKKDMPGRSSVNLVVFLLLTTVLFYLFIYQSQILVYASLVIKESIYNILTGILLYGVFKYARTGIYY